MKPLHEIDDFGGTDADNDDLLLRAFEDHEAYQAVVAMRRHMVIGKKGSGKTAIFKKIITTHAHDFFAYGRTFSDYPWHHHELQAQVGIPDFDKYTHSWEVPNSPLHSMTEAWRKWFGLELSLSIRTGAEIPT